MSTNPYQSPHAPGPKNARSRLLPVAISLLVVSLFWVFASLFAITYFVGMLLDPEWPENLRGIYVTYIMYMSISIAYSLLLCTGAFSMIRGGSYAWATVTSCLALVPMLGPCYFLAVPIGIWALVLLRDKSVRASFSKDTLLPVDQPGSSPNG